MFCRLEQNGFIYKLEILKATCDLQGTVGIKIKEQHASGEEETTLSECELIVKALSKTFFAKRLSAEETFEEHERAVFEVELSSKHESKSPETEAVWLLNSEVIREGNAEINSECIGKRVYRLTISNINMSDFNRSEVTFRAGVYTSTCRVFVRG